MANDGDLVLCYHKGCGKQFDPKNNPNGKYLPILY